jgi:hypothetical protein
MKMKRYLALLRKALLTALRGRSSTTSTSEATTELRLELAGSTALALLSLVTAAVLATVTATSTTASTTALTVITAEHTPGRSRALLLDVGLGNDLGREVEPFAEVVETLRGEGVVVPLPREAGLEVTARGQRLASLDNVKVLSVDLAVLGKVEVLLSNQNSLSEEVLVDLLAVGLGDEHLDGLRKTREC